MKDNTTVIVEKHTREELVIITSCPVCFGSVGAVVMVKDNTKTIKMPCSHCDSLLLVPVSTGHNKVIRKGAKK